MTKKLFLPLLMIQRIMPTKFKEVQIIPCDKGENNYIAFEVIASKNYLHEKTLKRGELCTSIDALSMP